MVSSTEHSKTDEDRDAVGESPPEAVASQPIRMRSWPSSRIVGDARSRIWTTCARGMPANWTANEQRNDPGWPAPGCPSWTTWSGRSLIRVTSPTRSSRACGAFSSQALQVLEQLGYPRDAEAGVPFDPQRHEVVGVVEHGDSAPGTVVEVLRPGYGQGSSATAAGGRGGQPTRGVRSGGPRLLRSPRGVAGRDRRSDPAGVPHAGPQVPPGCQQGSSGRRPVQRGQ